MKNLAYTAMVACLAAIAITSCKPKNQPEPEPVDKAPHWTVQMPKVTSCNWQAPERDHEPRFMTIVCQLPLEDSKHTNDDRIAVFTDLGGELIGLSELNNYVEFGQLYVVGPSNTADNQFHLCFYSGEEQQYYATESTTGTDAFNTFSNYGSIGSFANPYSPRWVACGPYTCCAHVSVVLEDELEPEGDELALFVNGECRTVSWFESVVSGFQYTYTFLLPLASLDEVEVEARLYRASSQTRQSSTTLFAFGSPVIIQF